MGQIANRMLIEAIFKAKEKLKEKERCLHNKHEQINERKLRNV